MNIADALSIAADKQRRLTAREVFVSLDALSRTRSLTDEETSALHRAIKIIDGGQERTPIHAGGYIKWSVAMDNRMIRLRKDGHSFGTIARSMGISKGAVTSRFHRLQARGIAA